MNAQDGSGFSSANFLPPPDGQHGSVHCNICARRCGVMIFLSECRMYLWNTANPYRDGALDKGVIVHELAHGLSMCLTGDLKDSGCLGWGESGGGKYSCGL